MKIEFDTGIINEVKEIDNVNEAIIVTLLAKKNFASLYHFLYELDSDIDTKEYLTCLIVEGVILQRSELNLEKDIQQSHDIPKLLYLRKDIEQYTNPRNGNVQSWIDEWRNMWPKGVKSGGHRVRGSRNGCLKKMRKFIKENPDFSVDEIFDATRNYILNRKKQNYEYMRVAEYFIEKDRMSDLASWVEDRREGNEEEKDNSEIFKKDL